MTTVRHLLVGLFLAVSALPTPVSAQSLPPDGEAATARLDASPRHGEWITYDAGAGHGFLKGQTRMEGDNMAASEQAWPKTIAFFRELLDS